MSRRTDARSHDDLSMALAALWRVPHPGPDNLFTSPAFKALTEACGRQHTGFGLQSALHNILRSIGAPFALPKDSCHLASSPEEAAAAIQQELARTSTRRRYLCPLDLADNLPALQFGSGRIMDLTAEELGGLIDADRLARFYPDHAIDLDRLARFTWLIVDESVSVDNRPAVRAMPFLFEGLDRDFGAIDPHKGHFPQPVAEALFFLLLGPWEDWGNYAEVNWRGFQIPWVYVFDEDLSVRPQAPPDPDTLSWEPWIIDDPYEGEIELERPVVFPINGGAAEELSEWNETAWHAVALARQSPLFTTPVAHFLIQAFHLDGIDELLAHISSIEAALGLHSDMKKRKGDPFPQASSTSRLAARIAALLGEKDAARRFKILFGLRSDFIHGRANVGQIASNLRVDARRLARRVCAALVDRASTDGRTREQILAELLAEGMAMN